MGQFLKQAFASLIGTLVGLFLFLALGASALGLLFIVSVSSLSKGEGMKVKDKTVLVFDLSTAISDAQPTARLGEVFSSNQGPLVLSLRQMINAIDRAAKDENIVGLLLDGRLPPSDNGLAVLAEVRAALERFRKTGKKIIAYDVDWQEPDLYLASLADTVIVHPLGTVTIDGFSTEPLFFSGALDKYGIGVQVVRAGNYKSAVEPYTRQSLSPESREQTQALLTDLWQEFRAQVAQSRQLTPQKIQAIADTQGSLEPQEARASGIVDRVAYFDEVVTDLKKLTEVKEEEEPFRQINLGEYVGTSSSETNRTENKIALIYAEGSIVDGEGTIGQIGGYSLARELRQLRQDEDIKAVVLRINSPGGSATASEIIWREVQLINAEKPVIVSMGNVAASGGYWIATGADYIFAEASTITGSIGVFGLLPNVQEIANENGITWDSVQTGRLANSTTLTRPKTEQELALFQEFVNRTYNIFLDKVAKARKLPKARVAEIAQGRVWSGEDAKQVGLVDRIGGLETAIDYAAQSAKLGEDWEIEEYPKQRDLGELVENLLGVRTLNAAQPFDPLSSELLNWKEELPLFQSLNDPKGIYARLPFSLRIR